MNDNMKLLCDPDIAYSPKDLDELWKEYRLGKQFACMADICEKIAAFEMEDREASANEMKEDEPRQGASYWLECIERPKWFAPREIF
ncbi:hypothetical protein KAR91_49340 [Candidatus Pacearchaeota archaeon]|nr:hypothetical protein [Candidatus Pacearchaeota archaeon]